ncbi:alpha/beta fold hydrolase [Nocardia alni]|uniref:alpha/beta fold hydrolase n=1 Tax=Nocardia alni TaxID=2815723 RepID=UPI001C24E206|nr:alpha/beta hydrolase [Nocardia alni]
MDTVISADGTDIPVYDEGEGPVILMVHPGLDDGTRSKKLAALLARRHRVLRLHRRQYRLDLKADGASCSIGQEAQDVLAVARAAGEPVLVYGHSSGGVVTLEALTSEASLFAGAVIFEPPAMIESPAAGEGGEILARARAAIDAGRPGRAMRIFVRQGVGMPVWQATLMGTVAASVARLRRLIPCQIDDFEAIQRLGVRLDAYARITVPTVLLGGDRSPANLAERLDALGQVMRASERVIMPHRDHGADLRAPEDVARVIETLADKVLRR